MAVNGNRSLKGATKAFPAPIRLCGALLNTPGRFALAGSFTVRVACLVRALHNGTVMAGRVSAVGLKAPQPIGWSRWQDLIRSFLRAGHSLTWAAYPAQILLGGMEQLGHLWALALPERCRR